MSSFLTQCPHCLTSFRVTDRQLDAAEGLVRCGACLGIFSAAANRITVKPTPDEAAAAEARGIAELDDDEDIDALLDDSDETGTVGEPEESTEPEDFEFDELDEPDAEDEFDELPADDETAAKAVSPSSDTGRVHSDDVELLEPGDFDVPLGDLNLDIDEVEDDEFVDDSDDADDEEEYDDVESDEPGEDEDAMDEPDEDEYEEEQVEVRNDAAADTRLIDVVYEEYEVEYEADTGQADDADPEPSEEFEPGFSFDDEGPDEAPVLTDAAAVHAVRDDEDYDDDEEHDEDELVESPPPVSPRMAGTRTGADKAALHSYLADIEDDDALDPLDDDDALDAFDEPVLLEAEPRRNPLVTFALLLASLALTALLAWQYADANIERLSRSASFAPLLPYACRVLDCPAPQRAQPDMFVSEQLLVRSHPRYAQALEVSLVFRNDAAEAQPFPALELGFHDTSNRMVANRLFQPAEYLPPELQTSEMPAQSSIQVTLELVDPGSDAVNYTLGFRAP